jgi:hypothetical protein
MMIDRRYRVRLRLAWRMMLAVVTTAAGSGTSRAQICPEFAPSAITGTVQTKALVEASGLACSRRNPGVLWSHNDSGGANRVYALGMDGASLGTFVLSGAAAGDWEDLAVGPGAVSGENYIYVGDIGDNLNIRPNIKVYRVPEPEVSIANPPGLVTLSGVEMITLVYPDGPRDAETLMVDANGDIYIVTKRMSALGRVYRAAFPQSTISTITLTYVAEIPWGSVNGAQGATGGDISRDGSAVIVRRLSGLSPAATLWRRIAGQDLAEVFAQPGCDVVMPTQPQGEAICFAPHNLTLYTLSEGANQPIYRLSQVPIPGDADGDNQVDVDDLIAIILAWGACPAPPLPCPADLDGSGSVDVDDLISVILNWS